MRYADLTAEEAAELYETEQKTYRRLAAEKRNIDMTRGKPSPEQTELSAGLFDTLSSEGDFLSEDGRDVREYGGLDGIPEMRRLFGELFGVPAKNVSVQNNSSLGILYDLVSQGVLFGTGGELPWGKNPNAKFICLVPGYDRHFAITRQLGLKMISLPFREDGQPDIDAIEGLVASDSSIKGIWCVPKYSNPTGVTYSDEVVDRLAAMPAARDFRIFWDCAYAVHGIYGDTPLKNILEAAEAAGNPDRVYMVASTSKITIPGAGVAAFMSGEGNLEEYRSRLRFETIGPDKVVQLAHYRFLRSRENVYKLMTRHAAILKPRFDAVLNALSSEFEEGDVLTWTKPEGGYFISANLLKGSARETVALAAEAGVRLTEAGAAFPLGIDHGDSHIRLAPSVLQVSEIEEAMRVFSLSVKLSVLKSIVNGRLRP